MNISSTSATRQSLPQPSSLPSTLGNTQGIGHGPSATALGTEDTLTTRHHGSSGPLGVLAVHGTIMAAEQGIHFAVSKGASVSQAAAGKFHALGDISGALASGYLAYSAFDHAVQSASAGNHAAATAYSVSATLDAGLAVANTLALFNKTPTVSAGVSLGVGLLSTASAMWGAKLEQAHALHP